MGQCGGGARIKALILVRLDLWGELETCTRRRTAEGRGERGDRKILRERETDTDEDRLRIAVSKRKHFPLRSRHWNSSSPVRGKSQATAGGSLNHLRLPFPHL